jgi:hypothetical protein
MKKLLILAIAVGLGICLTVGIIFAAMQRQSRADSWSTESPGKTYLVRFSGTPSAPSWPFTEPANLRNRKVTIDVSRNGKTILDRAEVYGGHAYDSNYKELYPDMEWFSENGLHLWNREARYGETIHSTEILVTNNSDASVKYLYVKAGARNLYLIFDLPINARHTFHTQLDHWEDLVGCEGEFSDRKFTYRSTDFSRLPVSQSPNRYEVLIEKSGCSVTGQHGLNDRTLRP